MCQGQEVDKIEKNSEQNRELITHVAKLGEITGETQVLYSKLGKLQVKPEFCQVGNN